MPYFTGNYRYKKGKVPTLGCQVVVHEAHAQLELLKADLEHVRESHARLTKEMQVSTFRVFGVLVLGRVRVRVRVSSLTLTLTQGF